MSEVEMLAVSFDTSLALENERLRFGSLLGLGIQ